MAEELTTFYAGQVAAQRTLVTLEALSMFLICKATKDIFQVRKQIIHRPVKCRLPVEGSLEVISSQKGKTKPETWCLWRIRLYSQWILPESQSVSIKTYRYITLPSQQSMFDQVAQLEWRDGNWGWVVRIRVVIDQRGWCNQGS